MIALCAVNLWTIPNHVLHCFDLKTRHTTNIFIDSERKPLQVPLFTKIVGQRDKVYGIDFDNNLWILRYNYQTLPVLELNLLQTNCVDVEILDEMIRVLVTDSHCQIKEGYFGMDVDNQRLVDSANFIDHPNRFVFFEKFCDKLYIVDEYQNYWLAATTKFTDSHVEEPLRRENVLRSKINLWNCEYTDGLIRDHKNQLYIGPIKYINIIKGKRGTKGRNNGKIYISILFLDEHGDLYIVKYAISADGLIPKTPLKLEIGEKVARFDTCYTFTIAVGVSGEVYEIVNNTEVVPINVNATVYDRPVKNARNTKIIT